MQLALLVPLAKMDQKALVVMPAPQEDREMLDYVDLLANRERRENLERMDHL